MNTKLGILALSAIASFATQAHADDVRMGTPSYGGTGCPVGSASLTLSADKKSLKLNISPFKAEAGKPTGNSVARSTCNIAIPVHIPQGISVGILPVTFKGSNYLPAGGKSQLNAEFFFAGSASTPEAESFAGPLNQDFVAKMGVSNTVWSGCGQDTNLRLNVSIQTQTNAARELSVMTLDSLSDIGVQIRNCR